MDTKGAYVITVSLEGKPVVKPSEDGSPTHGGSAVLMPYAGRVRDGKYAFEGRNYELPVGKQGHAIHGFAKDERWRVTREGEDSVVLTAILKGRGYPSTLGARVEYSIARGSFSTDCSVKNVGLKACPLVIGFHPYFLAGEWRLSTDGGVQKYRLHDVYFPTGEKETYSFDGVGPCSKLDNCFRVGGTIRLHSREREVVIDRRKMPYLVLYNGEYARGKSVAIEPYTGLPDAYNNGIGLGVLEPGQSFTCGYTFSVSRGSK